MEKIVQASQATPPREGKVYRFNATTSNQVFVVPDEWKNQWIDMEAVGEVDFVFGSHAGLSVTVDQASSTDGTPIVLTPSTASGGKLREGQPKPMKIAGIDTHFAIRAGATVAVTATVRS